MSNDELPTSKAQVPTTAPRTIEQFTADAITFVTRHGSNADAFIRHMRDWQNSEHDAAVLQQNIGGVLKFLCSELAKRQFRSDGSKQVRLQIIADIEAHVTDDYVDHLKQTIIGDELVEWCDEYATSATEHPTT